MCTCLSVQPVSVTDDKVHRRPTRMHGQDTHCTACLYRLCCTLTYDEVYRLPVQPQLGSKLHFCVLAVKVEPNRVCCDVVVWLLQVVGPVLGHPAVCDIEDPCTGADLCVL
jgi:hypothetical protein